MATDKLVHLVPTDTYIAGVPAVEMDVTEEEAAELLRWSPPAFTVAPKKPAKEPAQPVSAAADPTDTEV